MIKGHIKRLDFSAGLSLRLEKDSILILVGPNNSGKSATLKDIKSLLKKKDSPTTTVQSIEIKTESSLNDIFNIIGQPTAENHFYSLPGSSFFAYQIKSWWNDGNTEAGEFITKMLISDLATRARLGDCDPAQALDFRVQFSTDHPFQYMYRDPSLEVKTSEIFRRAFKTDLVIHRSAGNVIPGYVGTRPELEDGERSDSFDYTKKVEALAKLEEQGDGMRSFASIVSRVITEERSIQLIDEPEAFLHPPQARLVAEAVADNSEGRQTFVATHSSEILQGLLGDQSSRVSVVRLARSEGSSYAAYLAPERISELWKNPILRFSKVLDGLFHDGVIVTEADADCRFYEAIASAAVKADARPDIHYTYSGGKDRISAVVSALASLQVPVVTIADFDILNNEQPLRKIIEAHGAAWKAIEKDWKIVKAAVEARSAFVGGDEFRREVGALLGQIPAGDPVPKDVLSKIKALAKRASPWENVKSSGIAAVSSGDPTIAANRLLDTLKSVGIFVAPLGEMEGFCRSIGGHGPRWVENVLKRSLESDRELEEARRFMTGVVEYLAEKAKQF